MKTEKGGSQECGSTKEDIKYIEERSANLDRYSDKLRESVERIFNTFHSQNCCRICGTRKDYHETVAHTVQHEFEEAIYISIDFDGTTFYDTEREDGAIEDWYLVIWKNAIHLFKEVRYGDESQDHPKDYLIGNAPREVLKELVKSNAIPKFLAGLSEKLKETEKEYKEVSEIAERMAQAI